MQNAIIEVEIELLNGEKQTMEIQEATNWNEIKPGTKALICLDNHGMLLAIINSADEEGVSFKIIGDEKDSTYHYERNVVSKILVEVIEDDLENCPNCGSEATGYSYDELEYYECFDCDHNWQK